MRPDNGQYVIERVEAQRSGTLIQAAALVGAAACIVLAAWLQTPINRQRKDLQLVLHSDLYRELPPEYAWISAAGGAFRGIAVDLLWMRAEDLKEEGKYYESHQLAKWICTLQPRFAAVWDFQAWNMAYNISVATHTGQERWQWVYNGIRLLRDEGIPNNPRVVPLYHRIAWTWFHKVGAQMDDFHMAYKQVWAATMERLLGAPPEAVSNAEAIDWFRPVAQAPRSLEALVASRSGVGRLVKSLADLGIDLSAGTSSERVFHPLEEDFFQKYMAYLEDRRLAGLRDQGLEKSEQDSKLAELFDGAAREDLAALRAFLRAKVLREQYKMDPQSMLDMTGKLGTSEPIPIDWRTPWAHAMYWAMYGTERGRELKSVKEFDLLSTDRILLYSLGMLAKVGRYVFRINLDELMDSFLSMGPDFRYIEAMHNKYLELGKKHLDEGEEAGDTAGEVLRSGHVNNLEAAIVSLYLGGREEEARKYLDYLARNYKHTVTGETEERYLAGLDAFVQGQLVDMIDSREEATRLIYSLLSRGYLALAGGRADEFTAAVQQASWVHARYQRDKLEDPEGRRTLAEFSEIRGSALYYFVTRAAYPLLLRSIVWDREQNAVKQFCYDQVIPHLKAECKQAGWDVSRAFPEPMGMQQWREERIIQAEPGEGGKQQ